MKVRCAGCRRFFDQRVADRLYCSDACERAVLRPGLVDTACECGECARCQRRMG